MICIKQQVIESRFVSCKICSKGALTYDDVDAGNIKDVMLQKDIQLLSELMGVEGDSHRLVEKLMLLANTEAAQFMMTQCGGGLLRKHDHVKNICSCPDGIDPWIVSLWEQYVHGAEYVFADSKTPIEEIRHGSLEKDCYTHFTSPIRRYADQIVHRIIKKQINNDDVANHVVHRMNDMQKKHRRFQRDMKLLEVATRMPLEGNEYEGVVLPFRWSESRQQWKIDIAIPELQMVYPLSWVTNKTKWLFQSTISKDLQNLCIEHCQTYEKVTIVVGKKISVRLLYRLTEAMIHRKCVLTCDVLKTLLHHLYI